MRDAPPVQLANYVKYIGTREGVEKIDEGKLELPATMNQQKLIKQLICDIPFWHRHLTKGVPAELKHRPAMRNIPFALGY